MVTNRVITRPPVKYASMQVCKYAPPSQRNQMLSENHRMNAVNLKNANVTVDKLLVESLTIKLNCDHEGTQQCN